MLPIQRKRPTEGRKNALEGATTSFASSSRSRKRPDTASTVNSFASARGFSSDDAYSPPNMTTSLPRASIGGNSIDSSRSSNHYASTARRPSTSSNKTSFDDMLRSGNTWVMSQTADIAKDEAARRRLVASSPDPARSSSSSSSSSRGDGGRRLIVRRASELIDSEDDDTAEGHDAMSDKAGGGGGPGGQRRRVTNPAGAGPAQETINEDVSAEATPRMTSPSSPLHAQGKTSPYSAAPLPSSIPVERSPSTSTRGSSLARYATPPSGGASPVLAPATALPVHPHHRDRGQDMPTSPSTPERRRANGQDSAQQQSSSPDAPSNAAAAAAISADARDQRQGLGLGVGPSQTLALPADQQNSTPRARSKTDASNASNATYMPFPTDSKRPLESISLAAEQQQQQQLADMDKSGTTFFKERMKKTSGFLRRLRGGGGGGGIQTTADGATSTPKLGDVGRSQTARATMSAAKLVPPSTPKLNRKASQNSVASEGGASVRSAPGGSSRATDYADEVPVPVPSIPSKFKDQVPTPPLRTDSNPKKETRDTGSLTSRRAKSKQREADGQRAKQSDASRSVSAPQGGGGSSNEPGLPPLPSKESMSSSSSNGSSNATAARPVAPEHHHRHVRKASSAHGGSAGSGSTEMRHALSAWASEMDQTLSTAAQDLDVKTKMQKPGLWGPTPQLPDFGHRNRSGSFMEEDEEANTDERTAHSAPNTPLDLTPNNSAFVTPQGTLRANSNFLQRANELGLAPPVPGGKVNSKSRPSIIQSDPARSASSLFLRDAKPDNLEHHAEEHGRYDRSAARSENVSNMTSVSYETAIDRQSAFLIHANRREAAPDANDLDVSSSSSEGIDPETSIRLITPASTADGDPSVTLPPSTGELRNGPDTVEQAKSDCNSSDVASAGAGAGTDLAGRAKETASQCWNEDESFKKREKIAEWLGGVGTLNHLARQYYFQNFDFSGLRLDTAFRRLCDKLFLRAETQQVDRILSTFSARYFECNPTSLFGSADVVHSVVFSLLLLNTDLHVADINDRMTRTQFVRNTLSALGESGYLPSSRSGGTHDDSQSSINVNMEPSSATQSLAVSSEASSAAAKSGVTSPQDVNNKLQVGNVVSQPREKARSVAGSVGSAPGLTRSPSMNSSVSRNPPSSYSKSFEVELENVLKDIYAAVKADRIRLPLDDSLDLAPMQNQRRPAKPSAPGSERYSALKRGSIRGIQGLLGNSTAALRSDESLSPSSFGGRSLGDSWLFAPSTSTATSSGTSTSHITMPTLGFANTLSQSIIREANDEDGTRSLASGGDDITDEELALIGPPWAKEGTLTRKHYWEAPQKRAKDKNWVEVFVVAQKGTLSVFRFGDSASSTSSSQQARGGGPGRGTGAGAGGGAIGSGGGIGGGNWLSNAVPLGHIPLAHTLANSLPPPGYSRARPHVFALTLPGGDVYFFQTGHEELVQEWVSTCNYWAARQSREPFAGGVSNMEYGWNRVLPQEDDDGDLDEADEVLANVSEEAASPSPQPDGGLYSASTVGMSSANAKGSDSRSVRSGRSGRSLRSRAGSALFQNWTDASSIALRERSGSSSIFEGQVGSGAGANTHAGAGRTGSAGALKRVLSHTTTSSAQGSAPGSPYRGAASNVFADNRPIYVNEWRPPAAPMQPSTLSEEDQLEACLRHTSRMETELTQHNSLREPMLALKPPPKALVNWERKSAYLLGELTKFQVYVDSLQAAAHLRAEMRGKREVEKMIRDADDELAKVNEAEEGPPVRTVETAAPSH